VRLLAGARSGCGRVAPARAGGGGAPPPHGSRDRDKGLQHVSWCMNCGFVAQSLRHLMRETSAFIKTVAY
jgi:hypothetical protein